MALLLIELKWSRNALKGATSCVCMTVFHQMKLYKVQQQFAGVYTERCEA